VANQIAAGEVVERPASVVKELVENSLDAGASRIDVEIEQAGRKRIRVRDDGCGIRSADLNLAVQRHATSKITTAEQLITVASLGFRGEALASIASVARVELTTRPHDKATAWTVCCTASRCAEPEPAAHSPGTSVEVRDLFHNVPARRRFLRAERTEFIHIEHMLRGLALSRFDVGFSLKHNQRQVFHVTPAENEKAREHRVLSLCGRSFLTDSLVVNYAASGLRLRGWLGRASFSRSQRDQQFLFVNGRLVRDKLIGHAVRQGYGEQMPAGRFPGYVLHLELDPALVDVNVHPTKYEVRFRDSRLVHDFLSHCMRDALCTPRVGTTQARANLVSMGAAEAATGYAAEVISRDGAVGSSMDGRHTPEPAADRVLAQLHGRYLLVESDAGLMLVDIAAAKAWLAALELAVTIENGGVVTQPLLIPSRVQLSADRLDRLEQHGEFVAGLGFDVSRVAERGVLVRRIPAVLGEVSLTSMLDNLGRLLGQWRPGSGVTRQQLEAFTADCQFELGAQMTRAEQDTLWGALVRRRQSDPLPGHVVGQLSHTQLAALLKRRPDGQ
jgi:DNA mismatch repair protein MutL